MNSITMWAVIGGVIGARLYHVITDWELFTGHLDRIPMIWKGGLGIPGGLLVGTMSGIYAARRRKVPVDGLLTAVAPAIPLAQSIGRWGNWWNQELFGRATTLPWALRIAPDNIPPGYAANTTFHPTFLYESLWSLALCLVLLQLDKRTSLLPGRLFAYYLAGYFAGRFWIEGLRIDPAHAYLGLRLNQWVAAVVITVSVAFIVGDRRRRHIHSTREGAAADAPTAITPCSDQPPTPSATG
ncbi:MAG: prolipoprotein diacylglyceryl transferase [Ilumatobacteraceae bacterium]